MPRLVALDLPWGDGFVRALELAWASGDAVAPLDPRLPPPAALELVSAIRPTHVVGPDGERVALDDGIPAEPGDALVVATSGSGAAPKAVVLTDVAVRESAEQTSRRLEVDPGRDKWLACIPLSHVGGLGVVTRSILTGTPLLVHERFDADAVERAAKYDGVSLVSLVAAALGARRRLVVPGRPARWGGTADGARTERGHHLRDDRDMRWRRLRRRAARRDRGRSRRRR